MDDTVSMEQNTKKIPKDPKKILTGRFFRKPLLQFLAELNTVALESRKITQSEKAIEKVKYSLENDFRPGFAPREHKLDAYSLAGRELAKLEIAKLEDFKQAECVQVRAQLAAAEKLVSELQRRLAELDSERGSAIFLKRQRELRDMRARIGA